MANTYIRKAFSTTGTSRKQFTLSMWIKRGSGLGVEQMLCECYSGSSAKDEIWLQSNDTLNFVRNGGLATTTAPVYRDVSSWYHFLIAVDSTQASNANRIKIYKNGVQQSLGQQDTIPQSADFQFGNTGTELTFGMRNATDWYFNGAMSHIHVIDGTAYAPTVFGETDATTGEWKAKTSPSVTYGTNGFFILKDGNSVTDQSGKGNNFTVGGGTLTNLKDNPDNVFATMNPLNVPTSNAPIFTNGNTYSQSATGGTKASAFSGSSTLGMTAGKYYIEAKAVVTGDSRSGVGISGEASKCAKDNNGGSGLSNSSYLYTSEAGTIYSTSGNISGHPSYANNDIIGIAVDVTNLKVYFSKNGVFENSHNPSAGSGGISITAVSSTTDGAYFVTGGSTAGGGASSAYSAMYFNFGNGFFGTTAVTTNSGNGYAGAEGASKFNYAVPSGYSALNTKGLNT